MRSFASIRLAAAVLALLAAAAAGAAEPEAVTPASPSAGILERDMRTERRVVGLWRGRVGHPMTLSGTVGALVARQPVDYDCATVCEYRGAYTQIEAGLTGGQVSAGWGVVLGEKGRNEHFLSSVYLAYGIKGAVLRTWGDAPLASSPRTLVGAEGEFTITRFNFTLGLFRGLQDVAAKSDDWVVTGGVGWGF